MPESVNFSLLAIPVFVLSGNIMAKAGISKRLVRFVDTCVGHKRGGIAIVCVIVACFFGAISGSGPATVAALGAVLIPAMVERGGFSAPFSTALMATSSSIAIVIPPSIAFCCICFYHRRIYCRYVHGRNRT
ncbi:MAG: TRAP transporter large permease subunit [Ruminococcus sp.]